MKESVLETGITKEVAAKLVKIGRREARHLAVECGDELREHGSKAKNALLSAIRRGLPPHGGRPKSKELDRARELRSMGWSLTKVAATLYSDYWNRPSRDQRAVCEDLRKALQQRRRRENKRAQEITPPTKPSEVLPPSGSVENRAHSGHDQDA